MWQEGGGMPARLAACTPQCPLNQQQRHPLMPVNKQLLSPASGSDHIRF